MRQDFIEITPLITLYDVFGGKLILNPRPSFSEHGWLPKDPVKLDLLSGAPLTIAGLLPVVCSSAVISKDVVALMARANMKLAASPHIYRTKKEYKDLLNLFGKQNNKLVFNHVHPPNESADKSYWVDPKLFAALNNKANLDKFVPAKHIPRRITIPSGEIGKISTTLLKPPLVIKAASEQSTGAGYDVVICKNTKDISQACEFFRFSPKVVVEEFIEIEKMYNIQFAKTIYGRTTYLGASEQITDASGHYIGNWIFMNNHPPETIVELGRTIMEEAGGLGYFGIGGFDIAVSTDGRILAVDLNFRLNGSTPVLLLRDSIMHYFKASTMLFRTWKTNMDWPKFLPICRELIDSKVFLPLSIYDSSLSPYPGATPLLTGVLLGSGKDDVSAKQQHLAACGII